MLSGETDDGLLFEFDERLNKRERMYARKGSYNIGKLYCVSTLEDVRLQIHQELVRDRINSSSARGRHRWLVHITKHTQDKSGEPRLIVGYCSNLE